MSDAEEPEDGLPDLVALGFVYGRLTADLPLDTQVWLGAIVTEAASLICYSTSAPRTPEALLAATAKFVPLIIQVSRDDNYRLGLFVEGRLRLYISEHS